MHDQTSIVWSATGSASSSHSATRVPPSGHTTAPIRDGISDSNPFSSPNCGDRYGLA